jgi:hypothetical protein
MIRNYAIGRIKDPSSTLSSTGASSSDDRGASEAVQSASFSFSRTIIDKAGDLFDVCDGLSLWECEEVHRVFNLFIVFSTCLLSALHNGFCK